jgi:hypothetical protein
MMLLHAVIGSKPFEEKESVTFEMSGYDYLVTQRYFPEGQNLQLHRC